MRSNNNLTSLLGYAYYWKKDRAALVKEVIELGPNTEKFTVGETFSVRETPLDYNS